MGIFGCLYEIGYWVSIARLDLGFSYRFEGRREHSRDGSGPADRQPSEFSRSLPRGLATRRHLCFLARKTLFRNRFFADLIHRLNAVPVDQEGVAKDGLKAILEQLQAGQAVLVFPKANARLREKCSRSSREFCC